MTDQTNRADAIIASAERMLDEYELWSGETAIEQESTLADAIEICVLTCGRGDIPERCRELVTAVGRIGVEWEKYWAGHFTPVTMTPNQSFLEAFNEVAIAVNGVRPPIPQELPKVKDMIEAGDSHRQIAKVYGKYIGNNRWEGPFWLNSVVQSTLIKREAEEPGSVLGKDWRNPMNEKREQEFRERNRHRLERLEKAANSRTSRASRRQYVPTEEEIIAYANEGAFLPQFPKQWPSITQEHAQEVLERHGIIAATKEDPRTPQQREDDERKAAEELREALQADKQKSDLPPIDDRILALSASGTDPAEIRAIVSQEYEQNVTPQKVGAVIREAEKQAV